MALASFVKPDTHQYRNAEEAMRAVHDELVAARRWDEGAARMIIVPFLACVVHAEMTTVE